jgi:hypothetical protein
MTEHSIEELERQYQQALSRKNDAESAFKEASQRLHDAKSKASGLIGKLVKDSKGTMMMVDGCGGFSRDGTPYRVSGYILKKNGQLGERYQTFYDWSVVDEATP